MNMTVLDLKSVLIHKISEIDDIPFLKALNTILDTKTETGVIQLTQEQIDDIVSSRKELQQGKIIDNYIIEKQVGQWLKGK